MRTMMLRLFAVCLFFNGMMGFAYAASDDRGGMGTVSSAPTARPAGAAAGVSQKASAAPAAPKMGTPQAVPGCWYDRGGLQSAYGAYEAAVRSYRQAITMAPHDADAHFQLGVAHGELHAFEAAVRAMTRAIDLDADESAYYYGRGRIYLLMGAEDLATRDFMEAGFRGHRDARAYLQDAGLFLE